MAFRGLTFGPKSPFWGKITKQDQVCREILFPFQHTATRTRAQLLFVLSFLMTARLTDDHKTCFAICFPLAGGKLH